MRNIIKLLERSIASGSILEDQSRFIVGILACMRLRD